MSSFDIRRSFEQAAERLGQKSTKSSRKPRSDRGRRRLPQASEQALIRIITGQHRPSMAELREELAEDCLHAGTKVPSRATIYSIMARARTPERQVKRLPPAVQRALYNLDAESWVPEAQIAFYCFNYGELRALSYAAGLPWLAIYQARRMPGWRKKSRGLIEAVARVRQI